MITGHTFTMSCSPEEFKQWIREAVSEVIEEKTIEPKQPKLYTRQETADILHVCLSSLYTFTKKGLIKKTMMGRRVFYKEEDIRDAVSRNVGY